MNKHIKIISIGVRTGKLLSQFPIKDRNKNQILNVVPKSGEKRNFFHPYCMEKFNSYDIKLSDEGSVFYEVRPSSKDLLTLDGFLYGVRWLILLVQITTWETLQQAVFIANMAQNMSIPTRLIVCRSIYHANFTESCIEDKSCNLFAELAQRSLVVRYFEEAFETYID